MEKVSKFCKMEEIHWVSSENNAADILTRDTAKLDDIGPDSIWMSGPSFLSSPREAWPVRRDFVRTSLPSQEVKNIMSYLRVAVVQARLTENKEKLPKVFKEIDEVLQFSNCLESRKRVLARIINAWKADSPKKLDMLRAEPGAEDLKRAELLILVHGMIDTAEAFDKGQLSSLMPFKKGRLIVTRGRLGERSLEPILGVPDLPILMPNSRVAEFICGKHTQGTLVYVIDQLLRHWQGVGPGCG